MMAIKSLELHLQSECRGMKLMMQHCLYARSAGCSSAENTVLNIVYIYIYIYTYIRTYRTKLWTQSKELVPAKTPNSMAVKIGETHAIVQCLLWCPAVWGKSSRAKYRVVVAALTCCFSCLSCAAMHIVKQHGEHRVECNTT